MEKIESFKVNHKLLKEGIYVSRVDKIGKTTITTFDIRMKKPNVEPVMPIDAMHTIEHLGATYLRNLDKWKNKIIYFGPMGCQTGFYLVVAGNYPLYSKSHKDIIKVIMGMFDFIAKFKDKKNIPGATEEECGNYKSQNLYLANILAANMIVLYQDFMMLEYEYPTGDAVKDKESRIRQEMFINRVHDRENEREAKKRGVVIDKDKSIASKPSDSSIIRQWEDDARSVVNPKHNAALDDIDIKDASTILF